MRTPNETAAAAFGDVRKGNSPTLDIKHRQTHKTHKTHRHGHTKQNGMALTQSQNVKIRDVEERGKQKQVHNGKAKPATSEQYQPVTFIFIVTAP